MNSQLETALRELDQTTDDLLEIEIGDVIAICRTLEQRADAITKLAFIMEENGGAGAAAMERVSAALARGEQATRRALRMKLDAIEEWTRLNQIMRGLDSASPRVTHEINCSA